ncbi:hypothetical protein IV203_018765 [Nitzschia inconspicua]|uniref:Uncharacterized protein n=1 Tax=Nitzschia inconspicua TaxID=303405 RepID=A0A9K3M2F5_9STRA|nr:hypothetical protein IV203_018765 [Nitzschia inconspicua]
MPKAAKRIINQSAGVGGTPSKFQRILRAVTFLPLTILLLERLWIPLEGPISGYLNVEMVASTTTLKTKSNTASSSSNSSVMTVTTASETYPLKRIVQRSSFGNFGTTCPNGTQLTRSKILDTSTTKTTTTIKYVPNTIHLAIERSCVTPEMYKWYKKWLSPDTIDWSTYLYDSPTQRRILRLGAALLHSEFPQLKQILRHCISQGDDITTLQLWKYLVLYIYGGIYVTSEYEPASTLVTSLLPIDNTAVLVMDVNSNDHDDPGFILSSPGHPLLYLALHHAMRDVILGPSSFFDRRDDNISPIHRAIMNFSNLVDVSSQPNNSSSSNNNNNNNNNDTVLVEMNNSKVLILKGNTFNPYANRLATNRVGSLSSTHRPATSLSFCREKILTQIFLDAGTNERI